MANTEEKKTESSSVKTANQAPQKLSELSEEELESKADSLGLPYIDLRGETIPPEVLREVPFEAASSYKFVPFSKKDNVLEVGMVNPKDTNASEALRFVALRAKVKTKKYLISEESYEFILKQYRTLAGEAKEALAELEKELKKKKKDLPTKRVTRPEIQRIAEEAPISKVVAVLIKHATEGRASDIHIEPMEKELKIRFRVDGVLRTSLVLPKRIHPAIVSRIKILSNLKIDETRKPQDGRFHTKIDEKEIDFRVSTLPTANGEKVVLRILDPNLGVMSLEELGFWGKGLEVIERNIKKPFGMILATGPTGCGKSTTLYTILKILNQEAVNIITLEDPVEYHIPGLSQSQIRPEIGFTFASGLRSILRQDPDIIMVGEIRDKETASLATHAALTGHLLLSTLHTNDAAGVIPRLVDMGIEPFLLPPSLNLMLAQRLVKKICPDCKEEENVSPKAKNVIIQELAKVPQDQLELLKINPKGPFKLYRGKGCKTCNSKGTKGRIAIFEAMEMTPQLEQIIAKEPSEGALREEAIRQGMINMKQDGILKALQGKVTMEEVLRAVEE